LHEAGATKIPKAMTKRFNVGDTVKCSEPALENECYKAFWDKTLTITSVATRYMKASEFYANGRPAGFHPGFDESTDAALYDFKGIPVSLYDWELTRA
jgi:hypothetical protein